MHRLRIILVCFLSCSLSYAQMKTDSLLHELKISSEDTTRVNILINLSRQYYLTGDYDLSLKNADDAKSLSKKLNYDKGLSTALINASFVYFGRGDFKKALDECFAALRIRTKMKDDPGIARVENTIGAIYTNQAKYPEALIHCLRALKIIEKTNDARTLASCHGNIGNIYFLQKDNKKALENFLRSLELFSKTNNQEDIGRALNALGNCYEAMGDFVKALDYFMRSLKIKEASGNKLGIATAESNIGLAHSNLGNHNEAIGHLNRALSLHKEIGNKIGVSITHFTIASVLLKQKKTDEALFHAEQSIRVANEIESLDEIKEAEKVMSDIYDAKGDHASAFLHYKNYIAARDSITNIANNKQIAELQLQYETEKKDNENKLLLKENQIQQLRIGRSNYFIAGISVLLLSVIFIALLFIRQNKLNALQRTLQLEQQLLRSQMNPHFIFNSLIAIESYIYKNEPREAGKYLSSFARLMRLILENSREEYIPLTKEIQTLEYYLQLQQNRFDDNFQYTIGLSEGTDPEAISIPPMLAQPFIENSIEHGLKNSSKKGKIEIRFSLSDQQLLFEVKDNGIGLERSMAINEQNRKHRSMATTITMERLSALNKRKKNKIKLHIKEITGSSGETEGTSVSFAIPFREI